MFEIVNHATQRYKIVLNKYTMHYLLFNTRDEFTKVDLNNVVYFEADGNYTHIVFTNSYKVTITIGLSKIEQLLETQLRERAQQFIRIGKSYIINRIFILQINPLRQKLILSDMIHETVFALSISKEALKTLKDLIVKQ